MRRVYITEEFPVIGALASLFFVFIICYFAYLFLFKALVPTIREKWPTLTTRERVPYAIKMVLLFAVILGVAGLLSFLILRRQFGS